MEKGHGNSGVSHHHQQQEVSNQPEQDRAERPFANQSLATLATVGVNEQHDAQTLPEKGVGKTEVGQGMEETVQQPTQKSDQQEPAPLASANKSGNESSIASEVVGTNTLNTETAIADAKTEMKESTPVATTASKPTVASVVAAAPTATTKKAAKRPRAKPGFGLRTSRTTIVETGQKRRSCICTNSKQCNELMTKWAKVSPPDYHYVQLPKEHNPAPSADRLSVEAESENPVGMIGTTNTAATTNSPGKASSNPGSNTSQHHGNTNMSDTDSYKNGFRYATLRRIQTKNPLPKDERVALCHYHPEVRPYLFWPKNTPSAQKYAIPMSLAIQLGYDAVATKCQGFNTEKYCYAVPTYSFEDAKKEIGGVEEAFYDRVRQIKTNPTQFVRDLRQCEEELKGVHKLRRRNAELLRRLDDRRRSIKRLRSVLKVQRHATKEAEQQQQQLAAQAASANSQATAAQQQYQQHTYQTTGMYHQQQQLVDPSQQQQQTATIAQPHTQYFQPPQPTQEQQAIGIVVGGIVQSTEQQHQLQQHEQQHHWTYTQYSAGAIGGPSGSENEQQHSQQQVQPTTVHAYESAQHQQQIDQQQQQQQQQAVPSPMDDHNNTGGSYNYAQQLEAAMAAAVAAGFKDEDVDDDHHHQGAHDLVGDVVDLDGLDDDDGFGGDHGDDDDLEDDDWSDTEQYRQSTGAGGSQIQLRPKKWPRKTVVLPPVSTGEVDNNAKKTKANNKCTTGNKKKRAKTTKSIATKAKKSDAAKRIVGQKGQSLPSLDGNQTLPKKIRKA